MPTDGELLIKRSRELITGAKVTVSDSRRAARRARKVIVAMMLRRAKA